MAKTETTEEVQVKKRSDINPNEELANQKVRVVKKVNDKVLSMLEDLQTPYTEKQYESVKAITELLRVANGM